ncbi:MAG: replication initiation protein [Methylococcales bacterium]|jgi:penicillin-insensitive murein DD-endopeptidase|nr:replication initiation protein [Methylococcales bacterium]MBT7445099.1 replication initiation protein [Methylococcales bacterium]
MYKNLELRFSALLFGFLVVWSVTAQAASTCYGAPSQGRLVGGVQLPSSGKNFTSYSYAAELAGRTYVHSTVKAVMLAAFKRLAKSHPQTVYKYAETGFEEGGLFKPHKTHRNGLSVDFMMPVLNAKGQSAHLPTHAFNRLGYDIEFDRKGRYEGYRIDFDALSAHLVALHKAAKVLGVGLNRVIIAQEFKPVLFQASGGSYLQKHIRFSKRRSWVRHDEHYHVDFSIPCL